MAANEEEFTAIQAFLCTVRDVNYPVREPPPQRGFFGMDSRYRILLHQRMGRRHVSSACLLIRQIFSLTVITPFVHSFQ
jgi:hypothetical protein